MKHPEETNNYSLINHLALGSWAVTLVIAGLCGLVLISCGSEHAQAQNTTTGGALAASAVPIATPATATPPASSPCQPDRFDAYLILLDVTRSMRSGSSPRPTLHDFEPLFNHMTSCGGDLAFGVIGAKARPLMTLHLSPPPRGRPRESNPNSDLMHRVEAEAAERQRTLADNATSAAWQSEANRQIRDFKNAVAPIFDSWDQESPTDIGSMLQVADAFFRQPRVEAGTKLAPVLVIFSDGRDDAHVRPIAKLSSEPTIVLVNAVDDGDLAPLGVIRFVDMPAALRVLTGRV